LNESFGERLRQAQDKFNLDSLEGRLSFYQSLGQIEDAGLRQALSEKYEAAVLKSQQIAATQGADAGEAFMAAAEKGLADEARIREAILKANQEGNEGAARFNEGLLTIQQRTDAERLRQVEAAGSQINAEYARQVAQLEEKTATSIDRLQTRLERATGATTPAGGPAAPTRGGTPQIVAEGAPVDLAGVISAIQALQPQFDRLIAPTGEEVGATKNVENAVRSTGGAFR
jgi:hypothetical protein